MSSERTALEAAIAAAILVRPTVAAELADLLPAHVILDPTCREVYASGLEAVLASDTQPDAAVLARRALERLKSTTPPSRLLGELIARAGGDHACASSLARSKAERLMLEHRRAVTAEALKIALAQVASAADPEAVIVGAMERCHAALPDLAPSWRTFAAAVETTSAAWAHACDESAPAVPTGFGFPSLEQFLALRPGAVIVLAARPGVGKTTLALNMATNLARRGLAVGVHTLEMAHTDLVRKTVSRFAVVEERRLEAAPAPDTQCRIQDAFGAAAALPIYVQDRVSDAPGIIRQSLVLARLVAARGQRLGLLILDYLQVVRHPGANPRDNRTDRIGALMQQLKGVARKLDVPVLAVSAMNRAIEAGGRPWAKQREPVLSDLRDSGNIESDADAVVFLYRPSSDWRDTETKVIVAKNRLGPCGRTDLVADLAYCQFTDPRAQLRVIDGGAT